MSGETVLVADSDPRALRMIELALRRAGFAVEAAENGPGALEKLRDARVQAAVCELAIGDPDGLALCRSARADERLAAIPFLVIGADATPAAKARAIEAGADEYLTKPLLLKELVQRIQQLLDRRRLSDPGAPAALAGSVRDLALVDVFQSLEGWRKDAVVRCENGDQVAQVWVREGDVVDAELGPLSGEAAFFRLMTWETGQFRVDFASAGRRDVRIGGGTQAALVEAMRRVDELGRMARALPMDTVLAVDVSRLGARLSDLSDDVNPVLRSFDGKRTLRAAIDLSPLDDLATASVVQQLVSDGILRPVSLPGALARAAVEAGAVPSQEARPRIVQFPALRGLRRERLRREAEQVRARIAAGEPVRLHHVVELPPRDDREDLGSLRRLSPAVGEAAKTYAPDAPLSRVHATEEAGATSAPPIAPVAATTPPPGAGPIGTLRKRWPWLAAAAAALALAWTLRPQPRTERKDSPWLAANEAPAAAAPEAVSEAVARGNDLFRQGKYNQAANEYRNALAIRPDAVSVLVSLGDAYLEADRPRSALEPLETAARLDPANGRAQLLLGTTYHSLGRIGDAVRAYRRYLELEPGSEFAKDVKLILANLGPKR